MATSDKVSVIIPVWNQPKLLIRALHSVLSQTHQNFEILVVGDGCPIDIFKKYAHEIQKFEDHRIQLHNLSEHKSCTGFTTGARPRNHGLEFSTGDYIAPLDDDDMWMPYHLEDSIALLEQEKADLVYGQFLDVGMKRRSTIIHGRGMENGFEGSLIGHPTVVYKAKYRDLRYLENAKTTGADRQLWTAIYESGGKIYFSPKIHAIHYSKVV